MANLNQEGSFPFRHEKSKSVAIYDISASQTLRTGQVLYI